MGRVVGAFAARSSFRRAARGPTTVGLSQLSGLEIAQTRSLPVDAHGEVEARLKGSEFGAHCALKAQRVGDQPGQ